MATSIFHNKTFVKLFMASFTSQLGSTIGNMAFAFYLLDHFSSRPVYATMAELMYSLPTLCVFFIVGVIADRFDRQKIAAWCDWIRAGLSMLVVLSIWFNILPLTFLLLFMRSAISKFFAPAEMALLQGILNKDQYVKASGLNETLFGIFTLFVVGLGALAYHTIGIYGAVLLDILSYIISGVLIILASIGQDVRLPNGKTKWGDLRIKMVLNDFKDGFWYILNNKLLFSIISGFFIFGFINGGFAILPMFSMKYKLSPDQYQLFASYFAIALGFGFLIGSALGTILIKNISKHTIIISGILIASILTFSLGIVDQVWIYLVLILFTGIVLAPVNIAIGGWVPELVDPKRMGRVSAWIDPLMMTAQSIALGLIALLFPAFISLKTAYIFMGFGLFTVFIFYLIALPRLVDKAKLNNASLSS